MAGRIAIAIAVLLFAGCEEPVRTVCPLLPTQISYEGPRTLTVGDRVEVRARPNRCLEPDARVEWTTSAPEIVAIESVRDTTATLRAISPGTAVITAGSPISGQNRLPLQVSAD